MRPEPSPTDVLTDEDVRRIVRSYDETISIEEYRPLTSGNMNLLFEVVTDRGTLVLKLVREGYTLGKDLVVYSMLEERGVPVPRVLFVDRSKRIVSFEYYLMEKLPGRMLRFTPLSDSQREGLYRVLGSTLARIHSIRLPAFGWLLEEGVSRRKDRFVEPLSNWRDTFVEWYDTIKRDLGTCENASYGSLDKDSFLELTARIDRIVGDHAHLLEDAEPVLLHNDYTLRNVLVMDDPWRVTGVLDVEFARAGHNELELAGLDHFLCDPDDILAYSEQAHAFLKVYTSIQPLSDRFEVRRPLYLLVSLFSLAVYETFKEGINDNDEVAFLYRSITRILDHYE
ncbi:MAG: phosphotransferase family protein [Candidatus Woesearchaeota archaeon]